MNEYCFPVPGGKGEEDIVIFVRRHFVAFLGQFLLSSVLLLIPVVILVLIYFFGDIKILSRGLIANFATLIFSAYYLVAITFTFISWLSFYYSVYIVTKLEIIEITQVGFFGRKVSQLSLLRVQDVTSSIKGFLPTLFSFGDVLIETASEQKESFLLLTVPHPQEISSKIMALHDEVVEREGRKGQLVSGEGSLAPPAVNRGQSPVGTVPISPSPPPPPGKNTEGEISHDDLDQGGEIDLK